MLFILVNLIKLFMINVNESPEHFELKNILTNVRKLNRLTKKSPFPKTKKIINDQVCVVKSNIYILIL